MEVLKLINPEGVTEEEVKTYTKQRGAARAVVFDTEGKVALLNVSKKGYYKLPGGGIEEGENKEEALRRECREELGCEIEIGEYLGETIEYRKKFLIEQHCFCWIAQVVGEKGEPHFEPDELEDGFKIEWYPLNEAISVVEKGQRSNYQSQYIIEREATFLKEAQKLRL